MKKRLFTYALCLAIVVGLLTSCAIIDPRACDGTHTARFINESGTNVRVMVAESKDGGVIKILNKKQIEVRDKEIVHMDLYIGDYVVVVWPGNKQFLYDPRQNRIEQFDIRFGCRSERWVYTGGRIHTEDYVGSSKDVKVLPTLF